VIVQHAGDVARAREAYATRRGANLRYVLRKRYGWMRRYLTPKTFAVELGCGAGFSEHVLTTGRIERTDVEPQPWLDRVVDAMALPYGDASVDVLIANNVLHHVARPPVALREAARVLRPGGHFLVQECTTSLSTRLAIRLTGHESYDLSADPFDPDVVATDPNDPWSANCAIPDLLFRDLGRFRAAFPAFEVLEHRRSEFFVHFNSGGITSHGPYVPLPEPAIAVLDALDRVLVAVAPGVFASQQRVVLRKRGWKGAEPPAREERALPAEA
jgi:SAM-dependent methyltransferase